ncbi:DUF4411 family protein [Pontibacter sp. JH31]|uniref:DUF4411 family protein n=1 Tax=Pontibacter aquaedesilientis TaxID=2766980 RepID=A0ABR7XBT2_9BACT|nr:DUF4411 family protein [Pontibacter aquaedesilientis]MBD1395763.1 DUF4411 family protein [Pontibacter aquaedesilientis]
MSVFVVDSNFFIQAHRAAYPFDIFTSFWEKIRQLAVEGKIISIDKVKSELFQNEDALKQWCEQNLPDSFFENTETIITSYSDIVNWAASKSTHYLQKALDEFLDADEADAWLVSYALAKNVTIITHELSQPNRKNKIKIPDVCEPFGIRYTNTIEMLRHLGAQL